MSWLSRSLATSLRLDEDDNISASSSDEGIENDIVTHGSQSSSPKKIQSEETNAEQQSLSPEQVAELQSRGVKEDLTELKQTLTHQLCGVASFLAPPPTPMQFNCQSNGRSFSDSNQSDPLDRSVSGDEEDPSDSVAVAGIRDDFSEIGVKLSKMASDYFPFGSGENEEENYLENENDNAEKEEHVLNAVGITDEVLAFARNIAHHTETWLDFPLDPEEDLDANLFS
ncbi:ARM repeat superfamily protein [Hibiscus syriacus]|uniref:ARM repeat superfamily protein n=1 Tax=Hibiscus syriacus TaxID=106335 RepID=A0A6A2XJH6_HIBSY|nr:ARM repeat superfamily protein [Hibiscus syriacus]